MTGINPFVKDIDFYQRNYDILGSTKAQITKYIATMLGVDESKARDFVERKMREPGGKFELKDPRMKRLYKVRRGTREEQEVGFLEYVQEAVEENLIMSPSMVTYHPPSVKRSATGIWLDTNIKLRAKAKGEMFDLEQAGDALGAQLKNGEQNSKKIRINSVSGMRGFKGNPLFNATGHSTLTSTCRTGTGYGNATIERFISGARHYHTPEIVKANILTTINVKNPESYRDVIEMYGLVYPTPEMAMEVVLSSTDMYYRNDKENAEILELLTKITPLERALFCYSGDFYHIRKFNEEFARNLIGELIVPDPTKAGVVVPDDAIARLNKTDIAYLNSLRADVLMGSTHGEVKEKNPDGWLKIGQTASLLESMLEKYTPFISHFFAVEHLPPSIASIRSIQRKAALAGDTDSSIFTTQEWVEWYAGDLKRSPTADAVWYLITYMGCQCIAHSLAMLSANMGVDRNVIFRLSMKNEYGFPQFAITSAAKHYFCKMSIREGNVLRVPKLDTKGVGLRGSEHSPITLQRAVDLQNEITDKIDQSILIDEVELLNRISGWEKEVVHSLKAGEYKFLKSSSIRPNTINVTYYDFWQDILAYKYGDAGSLPVPTVSVNLTLRNKTGVKAFIDKLNETEPEMAKRFAHWMDVRGRTALEAMRFPVMNLSGVGIPPEFRDIIDVRKIVYQVSKPFYMILETLGLNIVDENYHQFVTEYIGDELE